MPDPTSKREVLMFVLEKLIAQGGPSVSCENTCRYRGDNGRKCAAGWLIEDDDYNQHFEGVPVCLSDGVPTEVGEHLQAKGYDLGLVSALQAAHDSFNQLFLYGVEGKWCDHLRVSFATIANQLRTEVAGIVRLCEEPTECT